MAPANDSVQNDIDRWLSCDAVRKNFVFFNVCSEMTDGSLLCPEIQEEQSSVCDGVSSEGEFFCCKYSMWLISLHTNLKVL